MQYIQIKEVTIYVGFKVSGEAERVRGKLSRPILTYYHNIRLQESTKRIQSKSFLSYILKSFVTDST
jgi:hypothetical protein